MAAAGLVSRGKIFIARMLCGFEQILALELGRPGLVRSERVRMQEHDAASIPYSLTENCSVP